MNTKVLLWMFTLTLALLVHGKEIKKRQIYSNSWSSNTGCNSGRCPLTSATTSCFPGSPGCGLSGLSGFSGISGLPLLSGYSGLSNLQSYSGYNGLSSFVSPYIGQTPLIINQPTPCAQGSTGCRVVQVPSPPQVNYIYTIYINILIYSKFVLLLLVYCFSSANSSPARTLSCNPSRA